MAFLITIAGGSGSGKTTIAEEIEKQYKDHVLLISIDHYYKDLSHLKIEERTKNNFDHPDSIDWELLRKQFKSLLNKEPIKMPKYSFKIHTREGHILIEPKEIIILEGIFALCDDEVNKLANLRIFVDTEPDIRFIRRLKRDLEERGRTDKSVIKQWIETVKPMNDLFIEPSKRKAHIIIPEDPEGDMRGTAIDLMKVKIQERINNNSQ